MQEFLHFIDPHKKKRRLFSPAIHVAKSSIYNHALNNNTERQPEATVIVVVIVHTD